MLGCFLSVLKWAAALAGKLTRLQRRPAHGKVVGSIPGLGHVHGLQVRSPLGAPRGGNRSAILSPIHASLSLSPLFPEL